MKTIKEEKRKEDEKCLEINNLNGVKEETYLLRNANAMATRTLLKHCRYCSTMFRGIYTYVRIYCTYNLCIT